MWLICSQNLIHQSLVKFKLTYSNIAKKISHLNMYIFLFDRSHVWTQAWEWRPYPVLISEGLLSGDWKAATSNCWSGQENRPNWKVNKKLQVIAQNIFIAAVKMWKCCHCGAVVYNFEHRQKMYQNKLDRLKINIIFSNFNDYLKMQR